MKGLRLPGMLATIMTAMALVAAPAAYVASTPATAMAAAKAANGLRAKGATRKVSAASVKAKARTVKGPVVRKANGKVTYRRVSGSKALKVNRKTGKITVARGTKAGTYAIKVRVTAKGDSGHRRATKVVKVRVRVTAAKSAKTPAADEAGGTTPEATSRQPQTISVKCTKARLTVPQLSKGDVTLELSDLVSARAKTTTSMETIGADSWYKAYDKTGHVSVNLRAGEVTVSYDTPAGTYEIPLLVTAPASKKWLAAKARATLTVVVAEGDRWVEEVGHWEEEWGYETEDVWVVDEEAYERPLFTNFYTYYCHTCGAIELVNKSTNLSKIPDGFTSVKEYVLSLPNSHLYRGGSLWWEKREDLGLASDLIERGLLVDDISAHNSMHTLEPEYDKLDDAHVGWGTGDYTVVQTGTKHIDEVGHWETVQVGTEKVLLGRTWVVDVPAHWE